MKQVALGNLQQAAYEGAICLLYLDDAGPVQSGWSPRGLPHEIEPIRTADVVF